MRRSAATLVAAAALVLAACGGASSPAGPTHASVARPSTTPTPVAPSITSSSAVAAPTAASSSGSACPRSYAAPDPQRPRVTLRFTVAPDLTTVTGTEHVSFIPDLPIDRLVFRLTANTPATVAQGNRIVVTSARADHGAGKPAFARAGAAASTQGGLLVLPFATRVPAGQTITADLTFRLTLGQGSFDRFGRANAPGGRFAWFGSGQPLLAWQRGVGWHTEKLVDFTAESATSEAADTDLTVVAPAGNIVIASGNPASPTRSGGDLVWRSHLDAARDVSVAVGPFAVRDVAVDGVALRVGAYDAASRDDLAPEFRRAITELVQRYGPFPFPSLAVARVPSGGGGIEYPGSILMLDSGRIVAVHETAHQYFYAMVGDSQALHPWLDEAFAQNAEELIDAAPEPRASLDATGTVDRSTESYRTDDADYYFLTYHKGAAALQAARQAVGATAWDAAMRCYVAANAWRIATPSDLAAALSKLPAAVAVLKKAGALP